MAKKACRYFANGYCSFGSSCRFSHDPSLPKPACKFYVSGNTQSCRYGQNCQYRHVGQSRQERKAQERREIREAEQLFQAMHMLAEFDDQDQDASYWSSDSCSIDSNDESKERAEPDSAESDIIESLFWKCDPRNVPNQLERLRAILELLKGPRRWLKRANGAVDGNRVLRGPKNNYSAQFADPDASNEETDEGCKLKAEDIVFGEPLPLAYDLKSLKKMGYLFNSDRILVLLDKEMEAWCRAKDRDAGSDYEEDEEMEEAVSTVDDRVRTLFARKGRSYEGALFEDPPLVRYARSGRLGMVQALLRTGLVEVDEALTWREEEYKEWGGYTKSWDWRGDSALSAAARAGHAAVCRALLAAGADPGKRVCYEEDGHEAAAAAARRGGHPAVAALIEGWSAAAAVRRGGHPAVAALIEGWCAPPPPREPGHGGVGGETGPQGSGPAGARC